MTLTPVKTAEGCRLRHPATKAVLPNVADTEAKPAMVNLADPHWYKALQRGDIEVVTADPAPAAEPVKAAATAPAPPKQPAPADPASTKA